MNKKVLGSILAIVAILAAVGVAAALLSKKAKCK